MNASSVARRLRKISSLSLQRSAAVVLHQQHQPNYTSNTNAQLPQRRFLGSGGGTRGARGHGWWVNYRKGKGGRHLQGTYSHLDVDEMKHWNDAVFSLGSRLAYLDVRVEALADENESESVESSTNKTTHRLTLELATEVLPKATDNVLKLLSSQEEEGYKSSTLHRIEKGVGILGGLVATNPNHNPQNVHAPASKRRMGACHSSLRSKTSPTAMDISGEKLVLNHLEGVLTMLQPRIGEIDSRFLLLSHNAPHLDGISVAVGRVVDGLDSLQQWESSLITSHGVPTNVVLKVVDCGVLSHNDNDSEAA